MTNEQVEPKMAFLRYNVLYLVVLASLFSVTLSIFHVDMLEKAAFLTATTLSMGLVSSTLGLLQVAQRVNGRPLFNLNICILATCAVLVMVFAIYFIDVSVFQDLVIEGVLTGFIGGILGLISALVKAE